MNKISSALIKKNIFSYFVRPQFYISAVVLELFCSACFFIGQNFFLPGKTFVDVKSFFLCVPYISILIIPFLVMHSFTESFDDILPFSNLRLLVAKWLSAVLIFIIQLVPLVFILAAASFFYTVDSGQAVCGFAGIILYFCAASAITIFIFELIPGAAFILSAVVLAVFNFAHTFLFYITVPDFAAAILQFVSLVWHFNSFGKGVFDTRDVFFFLIVTFFFLAASNFLIEKKKGKHPSKKKILLFFAASALLFADTVRYYVRLDATKNHENTLSDYSKNLLLQFEEPVQITYYCSKELTYLYPEIKNISDFLSDYSRTERNISFNYCNPSTEKTQKLLSSYKIVPQQFRKSQGNNTDFVEVYSAVVIDYLDKHEVIPFILSAESLEYDLAVRIQHLQKNTQRTVYVLCGNGLTFSDDYSYVIPWLEAQNFLCRELNPAEEDLHLDTADFPLLLLGSSELSENQSAQIESFALQGGKVLSFTSPYTVQIKSDWSVTQNKNDTFIPVLSAFGFEFNHQLALDFNNKKITFIGQDNTKQIIPYPYWIQINSLLTGRDAATVFWASPITSYSKAVTSIFQTGGKSGAVNSSDNQSSASLFETNPFVVSKDDFMSFSVPDGPYTVGAMLSGEAQGYYSGLKNDSARVIVISDQYFLSSLMAGYVSNEKADYRNLQCLTGLLLELQGEHDLCAVYNRSISNSGRLQLKNPQPVKNTFFCVFFVIIPVFIFLLRGGIALVRKGFSTHEK